jgi:predicted 3-demethylubiquinone-9 3-methyltransferase (glyoxalase superfamily)
MQKITPFLWYNDKAEEAANLYLSLFKNSKLITIEHAPEGGPWPKGSVMSVTLEIEGQILIAFNGGPTYKFTPAFSLMVNCKTQEEVDELWEKLSEGGHKDQCGWVNDKYGVSWQIVPDKLLKYLQDKDAIKAKRVLDAMMKMNKLIIADLDAAYEGK